jgi:hypothetical protein
MITLIKHPRRSTGLMVALTLSLVAHVVITGVAYLAPIFGLAMNLSGIEYVDEDYDRTILITFSKPLKYPAGYIGFTPPEKLKSLEEIKKEEERRAKREAANREAERRRRERERLTRERAEAEALSWLRLSSKLKTRPRPKSSVRPKTWPKHKLRRVPTVTVISARSTPRRSKIRCNGFTKQRRKGSWKSPTGSSELA